ncbi:hypothetical protein RMQ97_07405 [Maricaulis sp. D1M11]
MLYLLRLLAQNVKICPQCKGRGTEPVFNARCTRCNGRKVVPA